MRLYDIIGAGLLLAAPAAAQDICTDSDSCRTALYEAVFALTGPQDLNRANAIIVTGCDTLNIGWACAGVYDLERTTQPDWAFDMERGADLAERACALGDTDGCETLGVFWQGFDISGPIEPAYQVIEDTCIQHGGSMCGGFISRLRPDQQERYDALCAAGEDTHYCSFAIIAATRSDSFYTEDAFASMTAALIPSCEAGVLTSCTYADRFLNDDFHGVADRFPDVGDLAALACAEGQADGCMALQARFANDFAFNTPERQQLIARACELGSAGACDSRLWLFPSEDLEAALENFAQSCAQFRNANGCVKLLEAVDNDLVSLADLGATDPVRTRTAIETVGLAWER